MIKEETPTFNRWSHNIGGLLQFYRTNNLFDTFDSIDRNYYYYTYRYHSDILGQIIKAKGYSSLITINKIHIWHDFITIHHLKLNNRWLWTTALQNNKENMDTIKQLCR